MEVRETLRIATRSIRAHKLRSALTIVGVVIGIASVVTFATFGASVEADILNNVGSTSVNKIYVVPTPADDGGGPSFGGLTQSVFTTRDVQQLRAIESVKQVIPRGTVRTNALTHGNDTISVARITATTPAAFPAEAFVAGRAFRSGTQEIVINEAASQAFEGNLTVGETVVISRANGTVRTEVVGIVNRTIGELPFSSFTSRPQFYVPVEPFYDTTTKSPTTGEKRHVYPRLTVVADPERVNTVAEHVEAYLDTRSDAVELTSESVEVTARTSGDFVEEVQAVINQVTQFVTGIAVIALIVGAIGIVNIMLVSVTERTREIGIMKAVGARNRDIMGLFLTEATVLGRTGAIVGFPLGVAAGYGAAWYAGVPFTPAYEWFVIAIVVGILVGIIGGLYPAWRAAHVDPIDALRYE